jgi:hypothetical protein
MSTGAGGKQATMKSGIAIANIAPNFFTLLLLLKIYDGPLPLSIQKSGLYLVHGLRSLPRI